MTGKRRRIRLTIWQWNTGECTAFLDDLRVDGHHLDSPNPRRVAQFKLEKNAPPPAVLRALADALEKQEVRQPFSR